MPCSDDPSNLTHETWVKLELVGAKVIHLQADPNDKAPFSVAHGHDLVKPTEWHATAQEAADRFLSIVTVQGRIENGGT